MPILTTTGIGITYGVDVIFSNINVEINERARIGIVGPNGGGKTSLLEILTGGLDPSSGSVKLSRGMRVGYVPQAPETTVSGSLKDEIMTAFDRLKWLEDAMESGARDLDQADGVQGGQAGERYAELLEEYESLGGYSYENTMDRMVAGLGLTGRSLQSPAAHASGGERARAALAQALLGEPNLLILDEPTNHLDIKGLAWLERFLTHFPSAVVVVSHDRYFLDRTVNQVWEMDHGGIETYPGNYSKYRTQKAERALTRQREYAKQQEYIAKEEEFIRRYHAGQRAREAKGRQTRLNRLERIDQVENDRSIKLSSRTFQRSDQTVLRTHDLTVGFPGDPAPIELFSVPDVRLERGSRTALVGPNGTGKTTLLGTLLGLIPPLQGRVTLGRNVAVGYHRQGLDDLDLDSSVLDSLLDSKEMSFPEARSYLARFLFQGEDVFRQVGDCSGGERSRLALARLLVHEPNLLILDEPTTHLDIPSREALEQVLLAYEGTLLFVSHDRQFTSMLAQELWVVGDGSLQPFLGTFEEWMESDKENVEDTLVHEKPRPARTRPQHDKKTSNPVAEERMIRIIDGLETRLLEIQLELEEASEQGNWEVLVSMGQEYDRAKAELDEKLAQWGG